MKKFLSNILQFSILSIFVTILLVLISVFLNKKTFNYKIQNSKNILIVGDSHSECAINDQIFEKAFNFASSGTSQFYNYIKIKNMINYNKQIDTIILGFSYNDILKNRDSWFYGAEKIKFKLREYIFLMSFGDYLEILKANPYDVIINTPSAIIFNTIGNLRGQSNYGKYRYLNKIIKKNKNEIKPLKFLKDNISIYNLFYVKKIYDFCLNNEIELFLLNIPINESKQTIYKNYVNKYEYIAKDIFSKATLLNHSNFKLADSCFADTEHLNYKGAEIYSLFLKNGGLKIERLPLKKTAI